MMVNPREYWELMSKPAFRPITSRKGVLMGVEYETSIPPLDIPGFLEKVVEEINESLK